VTTFKKNTDDVSIRNERNVDRTRINEWKRKQRTKLKTERKAKKQREKIGGKKTESKRQWVGWVRM
jgi:hypothetical protein